MAPDARIVVSGMMLFACAHRPPTRVDSGDTAPDTAGDTGAPLPVDGPCGPWAGVSGIGTTWVYEPSAAYVEQWGFTGQYTVEVTAAAAGELTLSEAGAYTGDAGSFSWSRIDQWRCDADGAWLVRSDATTRAESASGVSETTGWRTFEPGWRIRPANAESWSDAFTFTASVNGGDATTTEVTCSSAVAAAGTQTAAGRTVDTLSVTPVCEGLSADPVLLGRGLGLIASTDEQLVRWSP